MANKRAAPSARHDAISHKHFVRGCVERMTKEDKEGGDEFWRSVEEMAGRVVMGVLEVIGRGLWDDKRRPR
ncbi:hypothetical protein TrRE_jg12716 [Triparma retinervis]|uniref:Uncharacterized protein n=2 Tax=Triparma TaxID=722752 RepID=A0A9W7LFU1_9STRA|nr:hypothetical protein TrRE_jg12716 [Triparma retinervis]GMI48371.1 hypothetical protein TrCOL_g9405 [Triparma columacea]